jgi:hypothetical protein
MVRKPVAVVVGILALSILGASGQDDKVPLRYKFEKGQKLSVAIKYGMSVKVEKIPEAFQGLMGENPVDLKVEGLLESEVREVAEDGKAALEGKWRTLKVKGVMMINEVDFNYDSEKGLGAKAPKKEGQEGDLPAFGNMEDTLRTMATEAVRLSVEPSGRMRMRGGAAPGAGDMAEQFLSLNGLMGPFPKDPIGKGDSWKGDEKISMPGVGGTMAIAIKSENKYEADETIDDRACAVLRSKLSVGGEGGDKKEDPDSPLPIRFKTSGEGEAKTWFCVREGMAARHKSNLNVNITVGFPDPGGGGDIEIKAVLKIDQGHEVKR